MSGVILMVVGVVLVIDSTTGQNRSAVGAACGLVLVLLGAALEVAERRGWVL